MRRPVNADRLDIYEIKLPWYVAADTACWGCNWRLVSEDYRRHAERVTVWTDATQVRHWHYGCAPSYATRHAAD